MYLLVPCIALLDSLDIYDLQRTSMLRLIGLQGEPNEAQEALRRDFVPSLGGRLNVHECNWRRVTCNVEKVITEINWSGTATFKFLIDWIPSSLLQVNFEHVFFEPPHIDTRRFPRSLVLWRMENCHLTGSIELRTLPRGLVGLNLSRNHLCGTVHLTSLPEGFRRLVMDANLISTVVVLSENFPSSFEYARFKGNPKIKQLFLDKEDPRIYV